MIYTVTLNPSIDYVIKVDKLTTGNINRVNEEHVYPGGKGINVTRILKSLDNDNIALGFVSGFTGDYIINSLQELNLKSDFIKVKEGFTRINVKVKSEEETEINGQGPKISEEELNQFYKVIDKLVDGDILILSGSIPSCLDERLYESIMKKVEDRDIKVIVDATKNLLLNVLKYKPFLIKPNDEEIKDIFGIEITNKEDVIKVLEFLYKSGAQNIFLTMGEKGSYFYNGENIYFATAQKVKLMSSACAGDSALAGFLSIWLENPDNIEKALKRASATGANVAESNAIGNLKKVEEYTKNIKVRRGG